ncbi:coiled-coil domain-containing protein 115 [Parasteatoda tepidariorum]|uniref:coiled-coil domain-containing protein 115 n=1 Tax=Parasteatoda tepidariorum TaxID=114398 RepID=UPI00077FDAD8|nr:coiled-coil domain-containing protein 115 [Parasteatoda tepidariorum]
MDSTNLESLNEKLDKLSLSILKSMQSIILERQYLEDNLKEGYINLAKSRYLMRGQKISMLQINTSTLKSSLRSLSSEDFVEEAKYINFNIFEHNSSNIEENGLKQRFTDDEKLSKRMDETLSFSECNSEEATNSNIKENDPLRWFGVLVPDSLKNSQMRFLQATKTALKLASLQNELNALCVVYRTLRLKKKELKE